MAPSNSYTPSPREQAFLDTVESPRYERDTVNGLKPFLERPKFPHDMRGFYSARGARLALSEVHGTERDVEARMPVKVTRHYFEIGKRQLADPLQRLVKANVAGGPTDLLEGSEDPGNQMDYSPVEGLLHKYEMGLLYVASTCSAHCRFCYREELIARKEIERQDGTVAKKGLAQIPDVVGYVHSHNRLVAANGGHPSRDRAREAARDPAVGRRSDGAAEHEDRGVAGRAGGGGVESIRIGTKEMAFYPERFDDTFLAMLDRFHETYPDVGLRLMIHFNHPDEFLAKDVPDGDYDRERERGHRSSGIPNDQRRWTASSSARLDQRSRTRRRSSRASTTIADALRIMQRALKRVGAENHYFFCGRDIVAYRPSTSRSRPPGRSSTSRRRGSPASRTTPGSRSPTTRARPRWRR